MNNITPIAQWVTVYSAGRRESVHGDFTAASLLLRPAEYTVTPCAFNLRGLKMITRLKNLNKQGSHICQ